MFWEYIKIKIDNSHKVLVLQVDEVGGVYKNWLLTVPMILVLQIIPRKIWLYFNNQK